MVSYCFYFYFWGNGIFVSRKRKCGGNTETQLDANALNEFQSAGVRETLSKNDRSQKDFVSATFFLMMILSIVTHSEGSSPGSLMLKSIRIPTLK